MITASPFCGKCGAYMAAILRRGKIIHTCRRCRPQAQETPVPPPCKVTGQCRPEHCPEGLTCKEGRK